MATSSSFLRLPPELRDMIYAYIFAEKVTVFPAHFDFGLHNFRKTGPRNSAAAHMRADAGNSLFRTCRQIRKEVKGLYYNRLTFAYSLNHPSRELSWVEKKKGTENMAAIRDDIQNVKLFWRVEDLNELPSSVIELFRFRGTAVARKSCLIKLHTDAFYHCVGRRLWEKATKLHGLVYLMPYLAQLNGFDTLEIQIRLLWRAGSAENCRRRDGEMLERVCGGLKEGLVPVLGEERVAHEKNRTSLVFRPLRR